MTFHYIHPCRFLVNPVSNHQEEYSTNELENLQLCQPNDNLITPGSRRRKYFLFLFERRSETSAAGHNYTHIVWPLACHSRSLYTMDAIKYIDTLIRRAEESGAEKLLDLLKNPFSAQARSASPCSRWHI